MLVCLADSEIYAAASSYMQNVLSYTGEGYPNPAYGNRQKNIMIFQSGGWGGLPYEEVQGGYPDPTWSLHWGKSGYMVKTSDVFLWQLYEVSAMSSNMAIANLIMPDEESDASSYGACWGGYWISGRSCGGGGVWYRPSELFTTVKWAAWMKGIQVAPFISINNYERSSDPNRVYYVLGKLQNLVNRIRQTVDSTTLKTIEGKIVILTEGINSCADYNAQSCKDQLAQILAWMGAQSDIFWIDNLASRDDNPAIMTQYPNIYRSAAISPPLDPSKVPSSDYDANGNWCPNNGVQDWLADLYGSRYLWHFTDRYGKTEAQMYHPNHKVCETKRVKWLNISPSNSNKYPVVISQWNEYGEFLTFEPSEFDGYNEFNYLQWRLSQQP